MIQINDKYRMVPDEYNVILQELYQIKEGKVAGKHIKAREVWKDKTFHNTVESALKSYANLELKNASSLEDLAKRIEDIKTLIKEKLNIDKLTALKPLKS
jgi:hypothetical protein